jgi:hypothetical protein
VGRRDLNRAEVADRQVNVEAPSKAQVEVLCLVDVGYRLLTEPRSPCSSASSSAHRRRRGRRGVGGARQKLERDRERDPSGLGAAERVPDRGKAGKQREDGDDDQGDGCEDEKREWRTPVRENPSGSGSASSGMSSTSSVVLTH